MGGNLMGLSIKMAEFLTLELMSIVFLEFLSYDETGDYSSFLPITDCSLSVLFRVLILMLSLSFSIVSSNLPNSLKLTVSFF